MIRPLLDLPLSLYIVASLSVTIYITALTGFLMWAAMPPAGPGCDCPRCRMNHFLDATADRRG